MKTVRILEVMGDEVLVEMGSGVGKFKMENPRLEGFPFERLNPLQFVFYRFYLLEDVGKNVLVVAPTSSGKTGVAMLFMGGMGTYAVPTRALANEIYQTFVRVFGKGKVGLRTGDVFEEVLEDRDITVCTYESLANGLRTNKSWVKAPFVIDEIHHIYKERGVVIEEIFGHLNYRNLFPILSLSATVPKPENLANLLGAEVLIESNYRPVPVEEKTHHLTLRGDKLPDFIVNRIKDLPEDEKTIVFVHKKELGYSVLEKLSNEGYPVLNETLPFVPVKSGDFVAFHNADIPAEEREKIEDSFRNGELKVLIATQTLAYGVNLPADRVIIFVRGFRGKFYPDVLDIFQMKGRAGRYGLRDKGYAEIYVFNEFKGFKEAFEKLQPFLSSENFTFDPMEYWGISSFISLMILGAVKFAGRNWRAFLLNVPSVKKVPPYILDNIYDYLESKGFVEDGKLTEIGKVLLEGSISPLAYAEMKRRLEGEVELLLSIRPLFYMKKIRDSLKSFLKDDIYNLKWEFKWRYYEFDFPDDGTDELWMYINSKLIFYPNISNPPGELGFSHTDVYHLARALLTLRENGYIIITDEDILRVMHSYKYGLNLEFAPLGGITGIGFVRANILRMTLREFGVSRVGFGKFEFPKGMERSLEYYLSTRYKDKDRARKEAESIIRILEKGEVLGDERIIKGFALLKFGRAGIKYLGMDKGEVLRKLGVGNF